ncbi:tyrosine-type recombinase/integrase [Proteus mirabilis]|uniref:integrase domain-containing protein n=1 Tax=Proteus mirabilis TaxID=584 RepID=UPI000D84E7FA|nr:integrase domain-containing protein [Proteus mirabilis]EKW9422086.1 tyrosine-type recombinase/integrase [Proteus mirabilis]MBB6663535.1 tyrosine-type recombinase/integrase [Proteus mirabilis]MBB6706971.1 tyrosine-type recombinase/integrase [Proteus mirabilis]MBB6729077.1 tyrosine-type recombinase/integrase [Proteus mirabilis]MBI6520716.1 tyrosine-type recombinase/integrase [Proteus mirabilis]
MARQTKPLSAKEIDAAKPKQSDYVLYDGDGLELLVKSNGSKLWSFRYIRPLTKKRAKKSLGSYPAVSLADARSYRLEARTLLAKQIDPQDHHKEQIRNTLEAKTNTFQLVAERWWEVKKSTVTEDYGNDIWRSLERDVFPAIGDISVTEIKAHTLVKAVQPVQARGALETVRRLCQRINEVMIYAQNTGLIDAVPSVNIGKAFEKPQKKNMPSIRPDQLPQLMQTMRTASISMSTRCLFMWQLLTITRPAEAAEARWDEIDFDANEWKIPAARMKMNRDHTVPLSDEAISILEMMKSLSGSREFIFPSRIKPTQPMNSQTVNAVLKRAGLGGVLVSHGLRSIASTALNEQGFPPDVIEAALTHVDKNEVRRAYNRSDYLEQRRPMMQWWADFVKSAEKKINDNSVIKLKFTS